MASTNLKLVQSICAAWERGEYEANDWADPDIEFVDADGPTPSSWKGLDGMAAGWRNWLDTWENFHQSVEEYRELDGERVLVLFQFRGRGRTSGVTIEEIGGNGAGLFHVRGGKVIRFVGYLDRERVLAELGLT